VCPTKTAIETLVGYVLEERVEAEA